MEERRNSGGWMIALFVLGLLLLPVLYVLSVGPYAMYYQNSPEPGWATILYAPLGWIANSSDWCGEWLHWYIAQWLPE